MRSKETVSSSTDLEPKVWIHQWVGLMGMVGSSIHQCKFFIDSGVSYLVRLTSHISYSICGRLSTIQYMKFCFHCPSLSVRIASWHRDRGRCCGLPVVVCWVLCFVVKCVQAIAKLPVWVFYYVYTILATAIVIAVIGQWGATEIGYLLSWPLTNNSLFSVCLKH